MPNILAHTNITAESWGDWEPDVILGSTLPDFAGMYKARYGGLVAISGFSLAADIGIEWHRSTDTNFDRQPEASQTRNLLLNAFQDARFAYKASRLAAAITSDILLDRALLDFDKALQRFHWISKVILAGASSLEEGFDPSFVKSVKAYYADKMPQRYADSHHIARIVEHRLGILSSEPDRIIPPEQVGRLASVIEMQAEASGELGLLAMQQTIAIMAAKN